MAAFYSTRSLSGRDMAFKIVTLLCVALFSLSVCSAPAEKRQTTSSDLAGYIVSVRTAVYVLDNIANATASCGDAGLIGRLDADNYNGTLAHLLLCVSNFFNTIWCMLIRVQLRAIGRYRSLSTRHRGAAQ